MFANVNKESTSIEIDQNQILCMGAHPWRPVHHQNHHVPGEWRQWTVLHIPITTWSYGTTSQLTNPLELTCKQKLRSTWDFPNTCHRPTPYLLSQTSDRLEGWYLWNNIDSSNTLKLQTLTATRKSYFWDALRHRRFRWCLCWPWHSCLERLRIFLPFSCLLHHFTKDASFPECQRKRNGQTMGKVGKRKRFWETALIEKLHLIPKAFKHGKAKPDRFWERFATMILCYLSDDNAITLRQVSIYITLKKKPFFFILQTCRII